MNNSSILQGDLSRYISEHSFSPKAQTEVSELLNVPAVLPETGAFLSMMVAACKPVSILDLGCGVGLSTSYLALNAGKASICAVDFGDERAQNFVNHHDIEFHKSSAENFLSTTHKKFDFVFVDTLKRDYYNIFNLLKRCLLEDSVIIFDDVLLYQYVYTEDSLIPIRYRDMVYSLRYMIDDVCNIYKGKSSLIPLGTGLLVVYLGDS